MADQRWYPTKDQLQPESLERTLRQVLAQHYTLQDQFDALQKKVNAPPAAGKSSPPPGSGPADSMLLGLRVAPVDTQALADGTKLTFVKKDGNFQFK